MLKSFRKKLLVLGFPVAMAALACAVLLVPGLDWRAVVVGKKLRGDLPDISAGQLAKWLMPGSDVWLGGMTWSAGPDVAVANIYADDPVSVESGGTSYKTNCSQCHGANARGASAPSLIDYVSNSTQWAYFSTAKWGRKGTAMAAQPISDREIWNIHSYLRAIAKAWVAEAQEIGSQRAAVDVTYEQLLNAYEQPGDWLMYSGDMRGQRHSTLTQITPKNVGTLRVAWTAQLRQNIRPQAASPIVAGGRIFVTVAPDGVVALDASNGDQIWEYRRPIDPSKLPLCCGAVNRGVAVYRDRVYVLTLDSYLLALNAETGRLVWQVKVAEPKEGVSLTTAPLVVEGHVVVGVAGGEFGIRGIIAAFSPDDGRRLWSFNVVPGPGEAGHESWAGDSWKSGGGSSWSTGVYDKDLDLIYWTTGNPWPPFDLSVREGDNLYTNSILALDRKTGKLRWYFQFTPHDSHDWDATQQPILVDVSWKGAKVPAVIQANRNGYYYALDRRDGKFLFAKPYVKQTWSDGLDEKGRPIVRPGTAPTLEGNLVWPWMHGGTNWWPPSYDQKRHLHFVPTVDAATLYFYMKMDYEPGKMTMGGINQLASNHPSVVAIKAIDPDTGEVRWSTRLDKGDFHAYSRIAGLVSTGGGIVFGGYESRVVALDSDTGEELWSFRTGGLASAGSISYQLGGRQYVATIAGNVLYAFSLPE